MTNSNNQLKNISYDLNPLSSEALFKGSRKYNKSKYSIIIPLLLGPTALLIPIAIHYFHNYPFSLTVDLIFLSLLPATIFITLFSAAFKYLWSVSYGPNTYRSNLLAFAVANDLYDANEAEINAAMPQSLNFYAENREATGLIMPLDHGKVLVMDLSFTVDDGQKTREYEYAIATLNFQKSFPHFYLDGSANGLNDLYSNGQQVQLEGNFNKFFRLFMPKGSSTGSLSVLSPDVMQTLIDFGTPFDIEVKGHSVAIITPGRAFTKVMIPKLLLCADAIYKELTQLEKTWTPVYNLHGKKFELEFTNYTKLICWATGAEILFLVVTALLR